MAFPTEMAKLTFGFTLSRTGTDEDVAEPGIFVGGETFGPDSDEALMRIAHGGFNAWVTNVNEVSFGSNVFLSWVQATMYNAAGHTIREQRFIHDVAWQGSGSGAAMPWETSLCCSLYTYPRGSFQPNARRLRGRFYTPPMSASVLDPSNSGYFSDSGLHAFHTQMNSFVRDVGQDNNGVQVGQAVVFSRVNGSYAPVIETSMDAKFDSQRRRENRETAGHEEIVVSHG